MPRNAGNYYLYIVIASLFAVIIVWIIQGSNNVTPDGQSVNSKAQDSLLVAESIEKLHTELMTKPNDPELNMHMANMLFDIQKFNEAIFYYRKTVSEQPEFISAQIDLSICYYNLGMMDTALTEMKKALQIDPAHMKGLFNMGVIYYNIGQIDSANYYWQQLLDLHPDTREADVARGILNKLNI